MGSVVVVVFSASADALFCPAAEAAGCAEVAAACAVVEVAESGDAELSACDRDRDIAPRPAKTMATAINTMASARSGSPPGAGFWLLTVATLTVRASERADHT